MSFHQQDGSARVLRRQTTVISPWVRLETIEAVMPGSAQTEIYHGLEQPDYVNVLCLHKSGELVLVRQYRPIIDRWTVEFPGGLRDGDESPDAAARREVEEETGLSVEELVFLCEGYADVGRLNNKLFGFFAYVDGVPRSTEIGIEALLVPSARIRSMAAQGEIALATNISLLYLAGHHPRVRALCAEHGMPDPPWISA
ncbi:MAG: NUDIX hydrolase [Acidobacteriaceae bacterium]|nr:NUDIX hydrolase [Acidobacteriaceae bacterium]